MYKYKLSSIYQFWLFCIVETYVVVLESMVVFLQENDKTFSLLSIDGKVSDRWR